MLHEVLLPQLGQTMEEGTIAKWHKKEGDSVTKGEVIYELTTDKATLEVEAYAEGELKKILVKEGQTVPVNELVAFIGEPEDELPDDIEEYRKQAGLETARVEKSSRPEPQARTTDSPPPRAKTTQPDSAPGAPVGRAFSSPRAKKLAEENSIPVKAISGTGPGGRIIERDVQRVVDDLKEIKYTPAAKQVAFEKGIDLRKVTPSDGQVRIRKEDVIAFAEKAESGPRPGSRIELSPMRQTIAERLTYSKQNVPHFYLVGDVKMQAAMAYREELNQAEDRHITITDLLVKAAGIALKEKPRMNAFLDDDAIFIRQEANVGVAVAVEDGLFVPVIRNADSKTMPQISSELKSLAQEAREGTLTPDKYEGGSLTISNLGTYGVDYFMPIINPPESCILGIGKLSEEIVVENGTMRIEPVMKVSISADHRICDGAIAAEFFQVFRSLLEDPQSL
jgi:pyruvate dehydrogenase E2 component (dihydrolipoamide acetyltransferase)